MAVVFKDVMKNNGLGHMQRGDQCKSWVQNVNSSAWCPWYYSWPPPRIVHYGSGQPL